MRPRKVNDVQRARIAEVIRMRQQTPSDKDLASDAGVSVSAIRKIMRELVSMMTVPRESFRDKIDA